MDRRGGKEREQQDPGNIFVADSCFHCVFKGWSERCFCGCKAADAAAPLQLRLHISTCNLQLVTLV